MLGLGDAVVGLGILGFIGFYLWLKEQRPRAVALEVAEARKSIEKAEALVTAIRSEFATVSGELRQAVQTTDTEAKDLCAKVVGQINSLASGMNLTRRATTPFSGPAGATPDQRAVLK